MTSSVTEIYNSSLLSRMTRLEVSHLCQILEKNPWIYLANSAYHSMREPLVTVVITLFNYSQYIIECLDSVCQSIGLDENFEVLVIDDGSTDDSVYVVEHYIYQQNIPICLVKKSFNTGLSDSRNIGVNLARSPYVFILDADNWIYPNCLSVHYQEIIEHDCAAVYGIINKFNHYTREGIGLISCYDWDIKQLLRGPYIDAMAMFKKEIVLQLGGYSTELVYGWEDYDLWLKIAQTNCKCKFVSQILSSYRVHSTSMLNHTNKNLYNISCYLYKKYSTLLEPYQEELDLYFGAPTIKDPEKGIFQILEMTGIPEPIQQEQSKQQEVFLTEQLKQQDSQIQIAYAQIEKLQNQYSEILFQLEQSKANIQAMETSKFWRLRTVWFKVKKILGLPVVE